MKKIVFRMDDVGASSKKFEVYSKVKFGNFLFLKKLPYFKAWGPYEELTVDNWKQIFDFIGNNNFKLSLGITAAWVDEKNNIIPFYEKFPDQAKIIKDFMKDNFLEINNHGLTHCVVGSHLPRLFSSNRKYHREFWDWVPYETQYKNLTKSCKIFENWLGITPKIFVPPCNVYCENTVKIFKKLNFDAINSSNIIGSPTNIKIINNENVFAFHDREVDLYGVSWLKKIYKNFSLNHEFKFLNEI